MDTDLPPPVGERHVLQAMEELRIEIPFSTQQDTARMTLQKGSCEVWGCELALGKTYSLGQGGMHIALFTWHGCVVDIDGTIELAYESDETNANVAHVNTHAQLEALREEAMTSSGQGPRVMVVGPQDSGKSSLCKTLLAYACKLGRTPLWVDLDPHDNGISVPGTMAVAPMTHAAVTVESYVTSGIPPNTVPPLVVWHGESKAQALHVELYKAQVDRLAASVDRRLSQDEQARASGIIVNTTGWIQNDGFELLVHAAQALQVSVILILGHDRLYSVLTNHYKKLNGDSNNVAIPKILKLPRSGGVVSRPDAFVRQVKARAVKRYFYGDWVDPPKTSETTTKVPQLTPFLLQIPFKEVEIYKVSSMALSQSLLPVAQQQTTDAIQLIKVDLENYDKDPGALTPESLQHAVLAVCHPSAVQAYHQSGLARDLVTAGVAGFCAVERVLTDTDTLHLLSPCAGTLPSKTLLLGDVTWME
eukprot:Nitzschia sp. Nitz4//scaffold175_size95217//59751//61178//NITZ4_004729-RA/size95217-processed-gene-0.72-mRNA-1//-1//CDS//3329538957//2371//frame0